MRAASRTDAVQLANTAAAIANTWNVHAQAVADAEAGLAAHVYDRPMVGASGHSDPTGETATAGMGDKPIPPDPVATHRHNITRLIHQANTAAAEALDYMHRFTAPSTPPRPRNETTTGTCQACERPVACTVADPLRGGHCNACRMLQTRWVVQEPQWNDNNRFRRQVRADIQNGDLNRPDSPHTPRHRKREGGQK